MAHGSDSYDGTSLTHTGGRVGPFATITKGCSWPTYAKPGDTLHVMPTGIYVAKHGLVVGCATSGTAGHPITIRGEGVAPNLTQIRNDGTEQAVLIQGSYQTWTNFDIGSSVPTGTLNHPNNSNTYNCIYSSPGGSVQHPATAPLSHIIINHNVIHDCGGNGIITFNDDYVTISNNIIYNNAHTTTNNTYNSGITILGAADADSSTGYKIFITGNIIHHNSNVPNCAAGDTACFNSGDPDGNGIILDVNDLRYDRYLTGLYPKQYGPPYHGRMLIENNLIYGNGGRCIHAFRTKHVDILNNTCYHNFKDPYFSGGTAGEIDSSGGYTHMLDDDPGLKKLPQYTGSPAMSGGDEHVYNNSITANGAAAPLHPKAPKSGCIVFTFTNQASKAINNQCYIETGSTDGAVLENSLYKGVVDIIDASIRGKLFVRGGFRKARIDPAIADFHPASGSPLLRAGLNSLGYVATDLAGVARSTTAMTLGAYEK